MILSVRGAGRRKRIVFRCKKISPDYKKITRMKDEKGRREWARENGMRWDTWDALASRKWVRMEDSGRVDDEGRPVLEKVDLMEKFFANCPSSDLDHVFRCEVEEIM